MVGLRASSSAIRTSCRAACCKRVELARALVVKPEILYMDEPLAALDALTSLQVRIELLRILAEERHTCVLITHDVEEAIHMADRILVLSPRPATIKATSRCRSRARAILPAPRSHSSSARSCASSGSSTPFDAEQTRARARANLVDRPRKEKPKCYAA